MIRLNLNRSKKAKKHKKALCLQKNKGIANAKKYLKSDLLKRVQYWASLYYMACISNSVARSTPINCSKHIFLFLIFCCYLSHSKT